MTSPPPDPWPGEVIRGIPRIASHVARRAPVWLRDEVASAAAMAMWEAWAQGEVRSLGGLRTVGRKAAGRAFRSVVYGCDEGIAYRVADRVPAPTRLDPVLADEAWESMGAALEVGGPSLSESRLGPILSRLVDLLVTEGLDRQRADLAVEIVADLTADVGVHAVYNEATSELAVRTGLEPRSCRALVVLMIGQPRARNGGPHPGLLERVARGPDIWRDPRVSALVAEVVRPSRAYVRGAWAEVATLASVGIPTHSFADETRSALT